MWSPIQPSHLTLSDPERSKLRCRKWSKIDTCIMRYCVRVNPRFQLIWSAAASFDTSVSVDNVIPTAAVKAEREGPWMSCFGLKNMSFRQ